MKRKILLPTDFSDNAWSAAVYALKLYANEECTFYFLNSIAIKVSTLSNISNKVLKSMEEDTMKELLGLKELAEVSNSNANHDFQIILSSDSLINAVKKTIKEIEIDLIVMGTKGATTVKGFFMGSNTVNVIKTVKLCPILVIPKDYDFIKPKQIAFPTDYNRFYDIKELNPLIQITDLYNSKIRIVHINTEEELNDIQEYNLMILQGFLNECDYSLHWMPMYSKKTNEINDFIQELGIDMLVMIKYKHSFIEKIINEPVIKKLGFQPNIPFLVIPE